MRILKLLVGLAAVGLAFGSASISLAGGGGDDNTGDTVPATVEEGTIAVSVPGGPGTGGGGGSGNGNNSGVTCTTTQVAPDAATSDNAYDTKVVDGVTYRHYLRTCSNGSSNRYWYADPSPRDIAANAGNTVKESLPSPTFGSAPPSNNMVVKFDMWMWATAAEFANVSATASAPTVNGPLSATVTARPLRLVFDPGEPDAQPVVCAGPGQAWTPADGDDADSACMYSYRHSSSISPTGTFTATWSIVWEITWTSSNGASGTLDAAYLTSSTVEMTVQEVQAIITG